MLQADTRSSTLSSEVLSKPEALGVDETVEGKYPKYQRKRANCTENDGQFKITTQSDQYFTLYAHRLETMRTILQERCAKTHPGVSVKENVLNMEESECILIGALYKAMPLKPNVLKEYTEERAILPAPQRQSFVSEKDQLFLEDEHGRTLLVGVAFEVAKYLSGTCVAVRGKGDPYTGEFETYEIILPGLAPQPSLPSPSTLKNKWAMLVSGINLGADGVNPLHFQLLVEYITGRSGSPQEHSFQKDIVRVVIAGNSIYVPEEDLFQDHSLRFTKKEQTNLASSAKELDLNLLSMARSCVVDLMPGERDPARYLLPQQPLNKCLVPSSSKLSTMTLSPNPHSFFLDKVLFLGHSGQPIDNIEKYMTVESRMELVKQTLQWRHIAPTAPDVLGSFPGNSDPFIIAQSPHVFFVGNQPKFETELIEGEDGQKIRIVLLPSFSTSHTVALVDLETLNCIPFQISVYDDEEYSS
eukprot:TRINITY_DN3030_c0_g1_i2.p1 TRINITY_DN3030_c0_g1~~TRINITY_DN3030_c0_g1_i2.p1  ORF type:complete len:471 (-),score=101.74 TRINITY_DN3030_c0_g1_i2:54-1466(-)